MSTSSPFLALLTICGFLFAVWAAAKTSKIAGFSPMLLEMAVGVLLGPGVIHLISPQYQVCENRRWIHCEAPQDLHLRLEKGMQLQEGLQDVLDKGLCDPAAYAAAQSGNLTAEDHNRLHHGSLEECLIRMCEHETEEQCERTPDIFTLIGHAGVSLMIFESGMHFGYDQFKVVGAHACAVAVVGTCLPLVTGALLVFAFGYPIFPDGIAAGTALAPTSCGVALKLLSEAGCLQEDYGQAIMVAAFVDDVLSLILFNVVFSIGAEGRIDLLNTVAFPAAGVLFMAVASLLAVKVWPWFMSSILLPRVPEKKGDHKVSAEDEVILLTMMVTLVGYATMTHFLGNHLWGCYFAGMSFSCLKEKEQAHHVWEEQTKRISTWLIRIFFSCTIAFSIPVRTLLSVSAIWKGLLIGLGPTILTKVCSGLWMGKPRFVIGWAMVGRAEFNFLIAQMAVTANMIDDEIFSAIIWAFLLATFLCPIVFNHLLKQLTLETGLPMHTKSKAAPKRAGSLGSDEGTEVSQPVEASCAASVQDAQSAQGASDEEKDEDAASAANSEGGLEPEAREPPVLML